jgi:peptidoglycan hydrolase-like protein with peptidoglycan-binding domain
MGTHRATILWTVLGVVGGTALGAWYAGSRIQSPAEMAARTAPPDPSPILVPVESRVLSSDVVTRGTVRFGLPQSVSIVPSTIKGSAGLIAALPRPNTKFEEGEIMLTVSGRPVFVLRGETPTFRDLSPGIRGGDVRQLEEALARLGFDPGPVDGLYDEKTSAAVQRWYKASGRDPFGPTREQSAGLLALEKDFSDAVRARLAASAAHETAERAVAAARALAEQNTRQAALDSAARAGDRRRYADMRGGHSLALDAERARAAHAASVADADFAAQINERALIVLDPRQTQAARNTVEARLRAAQAARYKARLEAELAIQTASREAALAEQRIQVAEAAVKAARLEGERSVRAAQEQQTIAEYDLKIASERAERLEREYVAARERLGVQVPADEIVFLPALPVRVHEVTAAVGASASGPVLTVTDDQLSIDSRLPIETAAMVRPGMKVAVDEQALGIKATGTVETVAATPGTHGVDGYHFYLGVRLENLPGRSLAGLSVRLTIPIETSKGSVTVVPTNALWLAADGATRVLVSRGGKTEYVNVQPGLSAGGYVEVSASGGQLASGEYVVVGSKPPEVK